MSRTRPFFFIVTFAVLLLMAAESWAQPPEGRRGRGRRRGPRSAILRLLDANKDNTLSKEEVLAAKTALLALDKDQDGNLTKEEMRPEGEDRRRRRFMGGMRGMDPMMDAVDKDHDGELFDDEVTDVVASLLTLDKDGDGAIGEEEMRPDFSRMRGGPGGFRRGRGRGEEEPKKTPEPHELEMKDGAATMPNRTVFQELSYEGQEVLVDTHLAGLEFVKFQIEGAGTDKAKLYFINTNTHRGHPMFMSAMGLPRRGVKGRMRGVLIFWPMLKSPNGTPGHYTYEFEPFDAFEYKLVKVAFDMLSEHAPIVKGKLSYNLLERAKQQYLKETEKYEESKLPTFEVQDRYKEVSFLPLNDGDAFGLLKMMKAKERPDPESIVIYAQLPNEMPRVAGVMTGVRQTPLSHVNLRAIQDNIPNSYIGNIEENKKIKDLVGKYVRYTVNKDGYSLREATAEEVKAHREAKRPQNPQTPERDLTVKDIRPFAKIGFEDFKRFGVKASNLATLRTFGFPDERTPNGFAIPFAFYDAFMKHNGFYKMAETMMAAPDFKKDAKARSKYLKRFRKTIKKGKVPARMAEALAMVQKQFGEGNSIRCRSSTNNEDLPGFSGAGLYDSFTHHPREGHLSKSVKQVYASLWNYRAFEARDFFRIDHMQTAMGVVLHPNQKGELANGVAVSRDILYQTEEEIGVRFYVNMQKGENLITNPDANDSPEELLMSERNPRTDRVIRRSSMVEGEASLLSKKHSLELRRAMRAIHREFSKLYKVQDGQQFAMEIEFKVTHDGKLLIKQARPWVFPEGPKN